MHYCKDCQATRSGDHKREHADNPLFLSYNMRLTLRKKYPHIYIFPQKHYSERLMKKLRDGDTD